MSKYRFEIEVPGLPKNPNSGYMGHYRTASRVKKQWRRAIGLMAASKKPTKPLEICSLTCIRFSSGTSDFDNLVASFKPLVDGLKDAGIIADDNDKCIVVRRYLNEKAPAGKGKIKIIVESIE